MTAPARVAICPACRHEGPIPRGLPMSARLRCRSCGATAEVRETIGPNPCRWRGGRPTARDLKNAAARDALARYGNPALDDRVDDLFRGAAA
jgi:hypothetical protein